MDKTNKLEAFRKTIDKIDDEILSLLEKRIDIVKEIGNVKKDENLDIFDKSREEFILGKTKEYNHSDDIKDIYMTILEKSKNTQKGEH